MNKLQQIINNKWFPFVFVFIAIGISVFQHFRIFNLDFIGVHTWRQTQTQTVILNFANEDFNILNPRLNDLTYNNGLYRMEFPIMQWLIAGLYKIFGNHIIITRLFVFCVTIFSVYGIYKIATIITSNKLFGYILAWLFLFSPIIYYYSVNPIPDNMALCFSIWCIYFWVKHLKSETKISFILSCVFLAFSIALKLPFIIFGGMYLSKFLSNKRDFIFNLKYVFIPFLICLPSIIWYVLVISSWNGNGVVTGVFDNKINLFEFWDIFQFNLFSTVPELLVNYATLPFFIIGFMILLKIINFKNQIHTSFLLVSFFASFYFFYEINMITKVHDYYLLPFLPLIFSIVLVGIIYAVRSENVLIKYLLLLTIIICPITAYLRCNTRWNIYDPGTTKEYVIYKKKLQSVLPKNAKVIVDNDESNCINLYYLNRKGWGIQKNTLTEDILIERIKIGATHICSDNDISKLPLVKKYLDSLILEIPPLKIYKLKLP